MAAKVNREANLRGGYGAAAGRLRPPAKFSWYPARLRRRPQPPRGLGNVQRRVLSLPRPRKCSAACFGAFRRVGNVQRRVLMLSEASEMFSGVFWSFPRPRKRSAARFDAFRGLGNVQRRVLILSEASGRLRPPAKFSWYPASLAGVPDGLCRGKEVLLVPGQTWPASLTPFTPPTATIA